MTTTLVTGGLLACGAARATAAPDPPPHAAVGGFATPDGDRFAVLFADGSVRPGAFGDAFPLRLSHRVTGVGRVPGGGGYWEVAADGNVFGYGTAPAFGGMGGVHLNAAVFAIAPTVSGRGYLLAARDGGVFAFGDAVFHGSAAAVRLNQPIVGMTTSPNGTGYRLVARDGGIFSYGKVTFAGSLPHRRVHVVDVVGMASTPSGNGYWIARSDGHVYAFGDAQRFGGIGTTSCDRVSAIIANPKEQGYRLVTDSGRTFALGAAPGGTQPTGTPRQCGRITARIELPTKIIPGGAVLPGYLVVDNQTRADIRLFSGRICKPKWALAFGNEEIPNSPIFTTECTPRPLIFSVGQHQYRFVMRASPQTWLTGSCTQCPPPLPPGEYAARLFTTGGGFPPVAPVPVTVYAAT